MAFICRYQSYFCVGIDSAATTYTTIDLMVFHCLVFDDGFRTQSKDIAKCMLKSFQERNKNVNRSESLTNFSNLYMASVDLKRPWICTEEICLSRSFLYSFFYEGSAVAHALSMPTIFSKGKTEANTWHRRGRSRCHNETNMTSDSLRDSGSGVEFRVVFSSRPVTPKARECCLPCCVPVY